MSDTPRTDKVIFRYGCSSCGPIKEEGVEPEFTRQLERELNLALEELKEIKEAHYAATGYQYD